MSLDLNYASKISALQHLKTVHDDAFLEDCEEISGNQFDVTRYRLSSLEVHHQADFPMFVQAAHNVLNDNQAATKSSSHVSNKNQGADSQARTVAADRHQAQQQAYKAGH